MPKSRYIRRKRPASWARLWSVVEVDGERRQVSRVRVGQRHLHIRFTDNTAISVPPGKLLTYVVDRCSVE